MEFHILGPLEASDGGRALALGGPKQRALLAVLLLHANEVVSSERLIDELWGESPPARAAKLVQHYVSGLRKMLPEGLLVTRPPGYLLRVEPGQLDLLEFERLVEEGKAAAAGGSVERGAELYRHALSLWRGPALSDATLESFGAREAERLNELRVATLVDGIELELAVGRHAELVGELEALVARFPFQERLRGQLMLALYRSGRQAEALEVYRQARRALVEELGLEPSEALRGLETAILQQDPSLDLAAGPVARPPRAPAAQPRRKTVTVLVSEPADPPADPEALGKLLARAFAEIRSAAELHGGTAERLAGGEVMAVFGVPVAHEDDALRAVRAGAQAQRALGKDMRVGLVTGEVLAEGKTVTGDAVAAAKRLAESAPAGDILLAPATLALVRGAVVVEPAEPLPAVRLVEVAEEARARPSEGPMVGRMDELSRLRHEVAAVREERRCRVVTVMGEAGIGKTRLARELVASIGDEATVLVGRCLSYGEGATYLPLREALAAVDATVALAGAEDAELVVQRVAELVGSAEGAGSSGEGFWAVRRLLESVARARPLVLVFEDVHWAEPTFLDLVEYLGEWSADAPILVVCLARPELLDGRPMWGGPTSRSASIMVQPLSGHESATLVDALAGELSEDARARIAVIAEGNPLFAEQLAAYATEEGEAALDAVPPTIEALLASRLDRLPIAERETLERAAVVGREFWHGAVAHLSPPEESGSVGLQLLALARRGLVRPGRSPLPPEDAYRFHHVLIRDVAYAAVPKERRAELHEGLADWLEQQKADDALVGYHLEQAYRLRAELGQEDGRAQRLAAAACGRLSTAGDRAYRVGDASAATNLLGRAAALLPDGHIARPQTLRDLGIALWSLGDVERAETTLLEAISAAERSGARGIALRAEVDLAFMRLFTDPEGRAEELRDLAARAIPVFESLGDDRSLGSTWLALAYVEGGHLGRYAASADAAERALAYYKRIEWVPSPYVQRVAEALYFGPTPASRAVGRCRSLLEETDRSGRAVLLTYLSGLEAMRRRFSEARDLARSAQEAYAELGWHGALHIVWAPVAAEVERLATSTGVALDILRRSCAELERRRERGPLSTQAGQLAHLLYAEAAYDEADRWATLAESLAAPDDVSSQLCWRGVRSGLLARRGSIEEAESVAREAVARAGLTDAVNDRARVLLDLAEVLRIGGRDGEAAEHVAQALALYAQKGNRAAATKTRALLGELATI